MKHRHRKHYTQSFVAGIAGFVVFLVLFSLVLSLSWWWLFGLFWILPWLFSGQRGFRTVWYDNDSAQQAAYHNPYRRYNDYSDMHNDYYNPALYDPADDKRKDRRADDVGPDYQVTSDGERLHIIDDDGTKRL